MRRAARASARPARHEGDAAAALVAHWLGRPAARFVVFRGDGDRPIGFVGMVALHEAAAGEIAADPGAAAMWGFVQAHAPTRPGDEVHVMRFFVDEEVHQAVASPSLNLVTVVSTQEWLGRRQPAWDLIAWMQPDAVAGLMAYIDFERLPGADYAVGERRYGVYAHDWRRMGAAEWLEVMGTRETAQGFDPAAAATSAPALALSQTDFGDAVRTALRDLRRPGALAASPLTRSRMVHDREDGEAAPAEVLEALLREAVAALAADPRDEKLARALDRTYLRPAATQERAAELLGLPFSTYRRHLARGTERVVAWLWQREVYGD